MRGVVTFKMLGSINVFLKRILMTPTMSTVTYTKNANFSDAQTDAHFVRIDITVINPNLRESLCNNVIGA